MRKACLAFVALHILLSAAVAADDGRALLMAARNGQLDEVKRLVESGVPVDIEGAYGVTALALAARAQALDVIEYLLEKGADPDAREGFFSSSVLGMALWTDDPEYPAAKLILAAGVDNRGDALATAFREGNLGLAQAAVAPNTPRVGCGDQLGIPADVAIASRHSTSLPTATAASKERPDARRPSAAARAAGTMGAPRCPPPPWWRSS